MTFDGEVFLVQLRRNRLARRYTLRIHSATRVVLLTIPPRGSLKQAREFADKHGAWIAARLKKLPQPIPFVDGAVLPLARRRSPYYAPATCARHGMDRD